MPFEKFANATLQEPSITTSDWEKMYGKQVYSSQAFGSKVAASKKIADDQSKYLLSHCSIMSSVMCEEDPFDYLIRPVTAHLVNSNLDSWENQVLKLSYKSFVGGFNFLEHVQNTKKSKGHLLDAILRKVTVTPEDWVYFVDLLVATDVNRDPQLVEDIRSGKMGYMSMGCITDLVICSFCGARVTDQSTYCEHLLRDKGSFLLDNDGIPRIVSELCGHKSLPNGGVKFVEASWVKTPAFAGAARRSTVLDGWLGPKSPHTVLASSNKTASRGVLPKQHPESSKWAAELAHILR